MITCYTAVLAVRPATVLAALWGWWTAALWVTSGSVYCARRSPDPYTPTVLGGGWNLVIAKVRMQESGAQGISGEELGVC